MGEELKIQRSMNPKVFGIFEEDLKVLQREIHSILNGDGGFWNLQFRRNNTITLYYKSVAVNFELKENKGFKLTVSKSENEDKISLHKRLLEKGIIELQKAMSSLTGISIAEFFKKYRVILEEVINDTYYGAPESGRERKAQQYIAAILESNENTPVLDYEVAFESIKDDVIESPPEQADEKKGSQEKNYRETDLLALKKTAEGLYKLVPVELKMYDNQKFREAIDQVNTYAEILQHNIKATISNYVHVIKHKAALGIMHEDFLNIDEKDISKEIDEVAVVLIRDKKITKNCKKEEILNQIKNESNMKWDINISVMVLDGEDDERKIVNLLV